ncbi:Ig-like domain-containing protein [Luteirhabdus pelagi]|uniref:Ig-like domain-containing protein n=1 Tax=Luteirhabdus pelagi TaxID=2792783 RepID=UPI00193A2E80|nr:Ig-like domain-containing protein [Luteirhabdus pelagi]
MGFFKSYQSGRFFKTIFSNGHYFSIGSKDNTFNNGCIVKTDSNGEVVYSKTIKVKYSKVSLIDMVLASDGNIVICGYTNANETFLFKLSSSTNDILWIEVMESSAGRPLLAYRQLVRFDTNKYALLTRKSMFGYVHVFNDNGQRQLSLRMKSPGVGNGQLLTNGVYASPNEQRLVFTCHDYNSTGPNQGTVLISTDKNLNEISAIRIPQKADNLFEIDGGFLNNDDFCFLGSIGVNNQASHYLVKWDINTTPLSFNGIEFNSRYDFGRRCVLVQNNKLHISYVDVTTDNANGVAIFDSNLNFIESNGLDEGADVSVYIPSGLLYTEVSSFNGTELISHVNLIHGILVSDASISTCFTESRLLQFSQYFRAAGGASTDLQSYDFLQATNVYGFTSFNLNPIQVFCDSQELDLDKSTITAEPTQIQADGVSESVITVALMDTNNMPLVTGGPYTVTVYTTAGTLINPSGNSSSSDGKFETDLRSSTNLESALLTFSVNGPSPLSQNTATVEFTQVTETIIINDKTELQSPHLYLQAVGSTGEDSTKGRHLRWTFRKALGEKHLPKGNYASNQVNFNKDNDFVKIYRAGYRRKVVTLDFFSDSPEVIDNNNYLWIYRIGSDEFYIRFYDSAKYDTVLQSINPSTNPTQFLGGYAGSIIEIENIKKLFFAVTVRFPDSSISIGASIPEFKAETLSVEENTITSNKIVSNRISLEGSSIGSVRKFYCENGRSLRGQFINLNIRRLEFEFYEDVIKEINDTTGWYSMGEYALTLNDETAFSQLEPTNDTVNGVWKRFNENAYVNISNYEDKWNATPGLGDKNIKQVVDRYIELSDNANNPTALEDIPLGINPSDSSDVMEVSHLDLLNFAAMDYHVARLLGLGILDINATGLISEGKETKKFDLNPRYLYIAEYYTDADLEDGNGVRNVHHLYMSLPTSNTDRRLPTSLDLDSLVPGVFLGGGGEPSPITDEDGYTFDGLSRYISLYIEEQPETPLNEPFFASSEEKNLSAVTNVVFGGLEHKIGLGEWDKPELSNDPEYLNEVSSGTPYAETRFILLPEPQKAYFVHRQTMSGLHSYAAYAINWFSRARNFDTVLSIDTLLKPKNPLRPPSNTSAFLIRQEQPLMFTSQEEQNRLSNISGDKTLIRLIFDYHSFHELKTHSIPVDSPLTDTEIINGENTIFPDDDEIFAEEVEVFFRGEIPLNIKGKIVSVSDHPSIEALSILQTGDYVIASTGETIVPEIPSGSGANFVGGVIVISNNKFIIHEVAQGTGGPEITVYKKQVSDSILNGGTLLDEDGHTIDLPITDGDFPTINDNNELISPSIEGDGYFMAFENMQTPDNWGSPNPLSFKVRVDSFADVRREIIHYEEDDGSISRILAKSRGIWDTASITEVNEPNGTFQGLYRIEFDNTTLDHHSQYQANNNSVDWYGGIARVYTEGSLTGTIPNRQRKSLAVIRIENIGNSNDLVIYAQDSNFDPNDSGYDAIETGQSISVNFYPGYKIYLYNNDTYSLNENTILPDEGEGMRHSIFGLRALDTDENYLSKISVPFTMFAQEIVLPETPEQPVGPLYATRPDYFGKATYTFATRYTHKPHGLLFYRSNDEALLNALYEKSTVLQIRDALAALGGNNEEYLANRWQNFLNFEELSNDGDFTVYPPPGVDPNGYKFPNPDKEAFFDWANEILSELGQPQITDPPGSLAVGDPKILGFVKGIIYNAFVPLTEVPILFEFLNGPNYQLTDRPQVIRGENGHTLPPFDPKIEPPSDDNGFRMGPMAKIQKMTPNDAHDETLFTDFKLDGTSNNLYFYGVKELGTKLTMSEFSPFLGPVKLVNTNAPDAPEIKRVIPALQNEILGIEPKVNLEINAYPTVQNIKKIAVYRSTTRVLASSIHSMERVSETDLVTASMIEEPIWTITDDFSDLDEIPFGDPLFYRVVVYREVEYADKDGNIIVEYAPSLASKIVASVIVENQNPISPILGYNYTASADPSELTNVSLIWNKTLYNGTYHLYKMNSQGNWYKIYQINSNDENIEVDLMETDLGSGTLIIENQDGQEIYHHFKAIAENTSGMLSTEENILTIPQG